MVVTSPESRANDAAYEATASVAGHMWRYWGELEIDVYMTVYKACLGYERSEIMQRHLDEMSNGSEP